MVSKVQTQLLLHPDTKTRVGALGIVQRNPQAEVSRTLIERALPRMEREHAADLARLRVVAGDMNMTYAALIKKMTDDKLSLDDVLGRQEYPHPADRGAQEA